MLRPTLWILWQSPTTVGPPLSSIWGSPLIIKCSRNGYARYVAEGSQDAYGDFH